MTSTVSNEVNIKTRLTPVFKQCIIATGVLLNNFVHAAGSAFPAVVLPQLRSSSIRLSREDESWVASILAVAMFVGNLLTVPSMQRGRKLTHYIVSLLNIAGWLIITLANNFQLLILGRFVQGVSVGLFLPVTGVFLAEYTSPSRRGAFLAAISLSNALGVFFTHFIGSYLTWQDTALLLGSVPVISVATIVFTPESPSWLATEGRYNECRKAFTWLRGSNEQNELNKMIQSRQRFDSLAETRGAAFGEAMRAITKRELYIPLLIGTTMSVLLFINGAVILANYIHEIIRELMGSDCNMVAWIAVFDGVRLLSNAGFLYVVRHFKRRTLLFSIGSACVIAHFALAGYLYARTAGLIEQIWLPALLLICHIITIGLGMMSMPYVILGEIFPLQYRGLCSSICTVVMVVGMFVAMKTFPGLLVRVGLRGVWVVYGSLVALMLIIAWRPLPETRGRTLLDIEEHFRGKPLLPEDYDAREELNRTNEPVS